MTRHGSLVGTPAYMAPEQHIDAAVTESADQYSFCLSLYVALFGASPFPKTMPELVIAKAEGRIPARPPRRGLPSALYRALLRGLDDSASGEIAELAARILSRIHDSGIGPGGLGGRTTALGVHVLSAPCHIAAMPVAVNIGCCAMRTAEVTIP